MSGLGDFAALVAAVAATFAAIFTFFLMRSGQKQVEVSQEQVAQSVEARQDLLMPVLFPTNDLASLPARSVVDPDSPFHTEGKLYLPDLEYAKVALKNAGSGIAFNLRGYLFEPEPEADSDKQRSRLHYYIHSLPVEPGEQLTDTLWTRGGPPITGDVEIVGNSKRFKLYAPKRSTADAGTPIRDARLTLTYSDVFGRKHAAIYDFTRQKNWETVAHLSNIDGDLADIEQEALRTLPNGAPRIGVDDYPGVLPPLQ